MLRVFTTGGTIDKVYFDALSAYQVGEPAAASVLAAMRVEVPYEVTQLMRKDSLEITDADREAICRAVLDAPQAKILVTHGTDTMDQTARALQAMDGGVRLAMNGRLFDPAHVRKDRQAGRFVDR